MSMLSVPSNLDWQRIGGFLLLALAALTLAACGDPAGSEYTRKTEETVGEKDQLYFVSASDSMASTGTRPLRSGSFPVQVWTLNEKGLLETVHQVFAREDRMWAVRINYDARLLAAVGRSIASGEVVVGLLDMDRPDSSRHYTLPGSTEFLPERAHFLKSERKGWVLAVQLRSRVKGEQVLRGISIEDSDRFLDLTWDSYRYVRLNGMVPSLRSKDARRLNVASERRLEWPTPGGAVWIGVTLPGKYPEIASAGEKLGMSMHVRSDHYSLTAPAFSFYHPLPQEHRDFLVLSRPSGQWHSFAVEGPLTAMRSYGAWLGACVQWPGQDRKRSPGYEERPRVPWHQARFGIPFDARINPRYYYLPGNLALYHLPTREFYSWSTGQGDSEILLVSDREVIFRVNTRILRAEIGDDIMKNAELLVEAPEIIPHIHWAFLGPEVDIGEWSGATHE